MLAANNAGDIWDEIIQPGPADNGRIGDDTLAYLDHCVPLNPQGPNCADVAVALVRATAWQERVEEICCILYQRDLLLSTCLKKSQKQVLI